MTEGFRRYATQDAERAAQAAGIPAVHADWRSVFLAISGAVAGQPSEARYIGPTRDAELWAVVLCGTRVDVIYAPEAAVIIAIILPPAAPAAALSPAPADGGALCAA